MRGGDLKVEAHTEPAIIEELRQNPTVSVACAGKALGVGRHLAYKACRDGDIAIIKVGRKWRVPSKPLLHMLGDE